MQRMKILWFVTAFLGGFSTCSFASAVPTLSIAPSEATVSNGAIFTVSVQLSNVTDLYDYQLDLAFNPAIIQADAVSEGTFLSAAGATYFLPGNIDNSSGIVSFNADTLIGAAVGASGSGSLLDFSFTAVSPGSSTLAIENEILQDSNGTLISDSTVTGDVEVSIANGTTPVVPEPAPFLTLGTGMIALSFFRVTGWASSETTPKRAGPVAHI